MQNIIKVTKNEIGNAELNSVNARDIHNYLQVKTRFNDWINRAITKYDFKENIDFYSFLSKTSGRPEKEYIVTMDMAKELAMLENNPKGKETRKYFIDCEKKLNSNSANIEKYFELFSNGFNSLTKAMENQQIQINNLTNVVMNLSKQNSCDITQNEQSNKKVIKNNVEIKIGEKALLILDYLLKYRGLYVSSKNLEKGVYPANTNSKNGVIRFHIHRIRQFLGNDLIISNKSSGYKIDISLQNNLIHKI